MPRQTQSERRAEAKRLRVGLLDRWHAAYRSGCPNRLEQAKFDYWLAVALHKHYRCF